MVDGLALLGVSVLCSPELPHIVMGFLSAQPIHNLTDSEIEYCGILFWILTVTKRVYSS